MLHLLKEVLTFALEIALSKPAVHGRSDNFFDPVIPTRTHTTKDGSVISYNKFDDPISCDSIDGKSWVNTDPRTKVNGF